MFFALWGWLFGSHPQLLIALYFWFWFTQFFIEQEVPKGPGTLEPWGYGQWDQGPKNPGAPGKARHEWINEITGMGVS